MTSFRPGRTTGVIHDDRLGTRCSCQSGAVAGARRERVGPGGCCRGVPNDGVRRRGDLCPQRTPSSRNWTPRTDLLSEAFADTVVRLATVAAGAGEVIDTVGGVIRCASGRGRISTMARLKRSPVGAVSLTVMLVPGAATGLLSIWTQYVSPAGVRNWCTRL